MKLAFSVFKRRTISALGWLIYGIALTKALLYFGLDWVLTIFLYYASVAFIVLVFTGIDLSKKK